MSSGKVQVSHCFCYFFFRIFPIYKYPTSFLRWSYANSSVKKKRNKRSKTKVVRESEYELILVCVSCMRCGLIVTLIIYFANIRPPSLELPWRRHERLRCPRGMLADLYAPGCRPANGACRTPPSWWHNNAW